jgi:pimeloyl-ACP methyl ester carboxylesterase
MKLILKTLKIIIAFIIVIVLAIVLLFGHKDIPLDELKTKYANSESFFISVNEMDVHFRDEGIKTDSIPIVLIHGTASSLHTFNAWTEKLKNFKRVIRMDIPAFGLTGPFSDNSYSISNYTDFLKDFLNALNIKQCILVGNSLGGEIAWNFTLKQPNMVQKLILIDAAGYPKKSKSVPIAFKLGQTPILKKVLTYITPRFMVKSSLENVYFDTSKVTDTLVERYFELTLRKGNRQAFVDRLGISTNDNYTKIKNIKQPTFIIWGTNDLLIPVENAYKFQNDLQNSKLVLLKNSGHTPMEENPIKSLESVLAFLKE